MGIIMKHIAKILLSLALLVSVNNSNALNLATQPLATQGSSVPPNLIFILDDSGSMDWDYLPDYINDGGSSSGGFCRTSAGAFVAQCKLGDPPYMTAEFNKVYYNPAIQYDPPKNADGTSKLSMTAANTSNWTSVNIDGYGVQSTSSKNLVTEYPDRKWCDGSGNCKINTGSSNAYQYPNSTYSTSSSVSGAPYYYNIQASEFCTAPNLKNCTSSTSPTGLYTYPAKVRWCTSSTAPQTDCQEKKVGSYKYVHYALAGGTYALGSLTIGDSGSTDSVSITSVKVNGVEVMGATITAATGTNDAAKRAAVAAAIAAAINAKTSSPEYTATAVDNVVTIKPDVSGTGPAGYPVTVTTPSSTKPGTGTKATGSVTFSNRSKSAKITNIKVAGIAITCNSVSPSSDSDAATKIAAEINSCNSSPDYTAAVDTNDPTKVNITAVNVGTASNGAITISKKNISVAEVDLAGGTNATIIGMPVTTGNLSGGATNSNTFSRVDIVPATTSYLYYSGRSCASGTHCTYDEEMTNFANWYAYYHTRMQMMKSAVGMAFQPIDDKYNVGYFTINENVTGDNVDIKAFDDTQKSNWYTQLYKANPSNSTPLREALSKAGKVYGGKKPSGFSDPVLFSCQQNFTILSTDGYWNGNAGTRMDGTAMGNVDNTTDPDTGFDQRSPIPFYDGGAATSASDTLADVAYYYYNYDLRNSVAATPASTRPPFKVNFGNSLNGTLDVSADNVADPGDPKANWQHMTTFTMGLGIDGVMDFSPSYTSDASGDYASIKNGDTADPSKGICSWQTSGTCNWPKPASDSQNNIDDLWHAAVNGHGTYFSASNPRAVAAALSNALAVVSRATGASAASATSSPNITNTDNYIFSSTYRTVDWDGEVVAQTIDPATGLIGVSTKDPVTGQVSQDTTPMWVASTGLDARVSTTTVDRTIYTADNTTPTTMKPFAWANMTPAEQGLFASKGSLLSQYSLLSTSLPSPTQQNIADNGEHVVNYLRGLKLYDGSIFRARTHVLGDTVNSVPAYDKTTGMLYIGANDGMLHAFDKDDGSEVWAFVPHTVMPNMYKLTDQDYANKHQYFVDGSPTVAKADGRTILIGGFNRGGKGYYALDVTSKTSPKPLWELCTDAALCKVKDDDIGWSYGNPIVTQLSDGTWVVLVTSGYESKANYLYVLDAFTGEIYHKVSVSGANGLAKITAFIPDFNTKNQALLVYGGDLDGNLWRFDFSGATTGSAPTVMKLAEFSGQPISTKPEVGLVQVKVNDYRIVVYVGTGKYIETTDVNSLGQQSLYALVDNGVAYTSPKTTLKPRTISGNTVTSGSGANEVVPYSAEWDMMWNPSGDLGGWYIDFPSTNERVNLDPQLVLGTLEVITNSPDVTASCGGSGGTSASYQFKFDTGLAVKPNVTSASFVNHYQGITVGNVIFTTPSGKVTSINTSATGNKTSEEVNISMGAKSKRNAWRSLRR